MKKKIQKEAVAFLEAGVPKSTSYQAIINKVSDALNKQVRVEQNSMDVYTWINDLYANSVVYSIAGCYYQRTYKVKGEAVTFGDPQEVELSYTPVKESVAIVGIGSGKLRKMVAALSQLNESYDATEGELTITVIQPGFNKGKGRYYPADMLKRDHKIFENAKMFVDHQTSTEERARPEGSVNDWVASISKVWSESDGRIRATAGVICPAFKTKLEELQKKNLLSDLGVSIRAIGEGEARKVEGEDTFYVESLLRAKSVDFVTYAGAGGRVEAMESDNNNLLDYDLLTETQLRENRKDLVELIESMKENQMKTLEEQLAESKAAQATAEANLATEKAARITAETKVTESEKTAKKAAASVELGKKLTESKLPEAAQTRIKKQFEAAESAEGMDAAITAEVDYVKSLGVGKGVRNMGEKDNGKGGKDDEGKVNLAESFARLGLDEKQSAIAAKN